MTQEYLQLINCTEVWRLYKLQHSFWIDVRFRTVACSGVQYRAEPCIGVTRRVVQAEAPRSSPAHQCMPKTYTPACPDPATQVNHPY